MKIQLATPHMSGKETKYIQGAFDTNWIAPLGPNVDGFERDIKLFTGAKNAVALSSGTASIHMALKALKIGKGDKVFVSTLTFAATVNPIIYEGAEPVFIDSEPDTWNMSPIALAKAFEDAEELPKAVIVVHLYGHPAKMDKIMEICNHYNVPVIEDAAESLGATYNGEHTGTIGDIGIYSFNGNKLITTSGGGMLVSYNSSISNYVRFLATQAKEDKPYYHHKEIGYNYRMSNVLAGIGRGQMEVIHDRINKKKNIFEAYRLNFSNNTNIEMIIPYKKSKPNYWLSCITLSDECDVTPQEVIDKLAENGVESRRVWKPMHMQPVFNKYKLYSHFNHKTETIAEDLFKRGICLPSDTKLTFNEICYVSQLVNEFTQRTKEFEVF